MLKWCIEATNAVMGRIEKDLASRQGVGHYATFVGQSAPRFYYNVNPQQPDGAYGQFIVNTASVEDVDKAVGWQEYVNSRSEAIALLDEAIFNLAHFVAGLSAVDGA